MDWNRKRIIIGIGIFLLIASFLLSKSLRQTITNRSKAKRIQTEATKIDAEIIQLRQNLRNLEKSPDEIELLVRRELGYLRPQEKEVRFVQNKN